MNKMDAFIKYSQEVRDALAKNRAVVALETTLISHGLPYPVNIELAATLEEIIRNSGAVPATIALIDGYIKIGLTKDELNRLGDEKSKGDVVKVSRKDIPYTLSMKKMGATTVAATMICASLAGIRVFATGGIGGVHREGHHTFDISADLQELARTNVAVVCSGAKSFLDIGRTLELLETLGVPVIGFQTKHFPAFYTRESNYFVDYLLPDAEKIAKLLHTKWDLDLNGGVIIANPIPKEDTLDSDMIEMFLEEALTIAKNKKVSGKAITPFLLQKLFEMSKGKTLEANLALLKNNARVATEVSVKYSKLERP